jgi:hypothetical protein
MQAKAIAKVTAAGNLELPPEILAQLEPLSEYEILMTKEKIILEKKNLTVRNHQAFLNGYVLEDEGLYDDYPIR